MTGLPPIQTWHVYDDCSLRIYISGEQIACLNLTPDQAIKLAADLIIAARRPKVPAND